MRIRFKIFAFSFFVALFLFAFCVSSVVASENAKTGDVIVVFKSTENAKEDAKQNAKDKEKEEEVKLVDETVRSKHVRKK